MGLAGYGDKMCAVRQEDLLLYCSDFTVPAKDWNETTTERYKVYRRDGYLHIGVNPPLAILRCVPVSIGDFKFCVDAGFVTPRGVCGVVFRVKDYNENDTFYALSIQERSYSIYMCSNRTQWESIADYCNSELIKPAPQINAWAVEMVGDKIAVEVNGHILARVNDNRLGFGEVGIYVSASKEYAEARFRNVCLYAIEYEEDSDMILPVPPQR